MTQCTMSKRSYHRATSRSLFCCECMDGTGAVTCSIDVLKGIWGFLASLFVSFVIRISRKNLFAFSITFNDPKQTSMTLQALKKSP